MLQTGLSSAPGIPVPDSSTADESRRKLRRRLTSVAAILGVLLLWQLAASLHVFPRSIFPSPERVVHDFYIAQFQGFGGHSLAYHAAISVARVLTGFIGAIILGVIVGVLSALVVGATPMLVNFFYGAGAAAH